MGSEMCIRDSDSSGMSIYSTDLHLVMSIYWTDSSSMSIYSTNLRLNMSIYWTDSSVRIEAVAKQEKQAAEVKVGNPEPQTLDP